MQKIQPQDIDTTQHFSNAFDNRETETSARWIVRFCQERGESWKPFSYDDVEKFYNEGGHKRFWFNQLLSEKYGIVKIDKLYHIKHNFIARCWQVSPAQVAAYLESSREE